MALGFGSKNYRRRLLREPLVTIGMPIKDREWCLQEVLITIKNLEYLKEEIKLMFIDDYSH